MGIHYFFLCNSSKLKGMIRMTNVIQRKFPCCNVTFIRVACSRYSNRYMQWSEARSQRVRKKRGGREEEDSPITPYLTPLCFSCSLPFPPSLQFECLEQVVIRAKCEDHCVEGIILLISPGRVLESLNSVFKTSKPKTSLKAV